jgi:hypothetical protein
MFVFQPKGTCFDHEDIINILAGDRFIIFSNVAEYPTGKGCQ